MSGKTKESKEAKEAKKKRGGSGRLVPLLLSVALGLAGYSALSAMTLEKRLDQIEQRSAEELASVRDVVASLGSGGAGKIGRVPQSFLDEAAKSIYIVTAGEAEGLEAVMATAWVVGEGVLATNAHVAELFDETGKFDIFVRGGEGENQPHRVKSVKIHAGYKAFPRAVSRYKPFMAGARGQAVPVLGVPGYDVALLYVERPEDLAPPLPLAPDTTLHAMKAGDPLAMVGYPLQIFNNELQRVSPNPRHQRGQVTAMTHFIQARVPPQAAVFIIHNVPGIGGNSGSPILNVFGEVVGIMSHGLGFPGENGAQRIDLLAEVIAGVDSKNVIARHFGEWSALLQQFETGHEVIPRSALKLIDKGDGKIAVDVAKDSVRYKSDDVIELTVCVEGTRPSDEIERLLNRQRAKTAKVGPQGKAGVRSFLLGKGEAVSLNAEPMRAAQKGQCPQDEATADGVWKIKTIHLDKPGVYLVYAFQYTFQWPCSNLQILAKPANEMSLKYISDPSPLPHVTLDVPEGGLDYHIVLGVEALDSGPRCRVPPSQGVIDFGVAHFRDLETAPEASLIRIKKWFASSWASLSSLIDD